MRHIATLSWFLFWSIAVWGQNFLGLPKDSIIHSHKECVVMDNYAETMVLNCQGRKAIFYFSGKDTTCDMYAMDVDKVVADDTLKKLLAAGFTLAETKYVGPFLVSKHSNHEKFPSRVYTDGKIQYCFMPVSLNGKTAELNSLIIMYKK